MPTDVTATIVYPDIVTKEECREAITQTIYGDADSAKPRPRDSFGAYLLNGARVLFRLWNSNRGIYWRVEGKDREKCRVTVDKAVQPKNSGEILGENHILVAKVQGKGDLTARWSPPQSERR